MSSLDLTFEDLYIKVSEFLSMAAMGTAPTGTAELALVKDIVHRGYRQFLFPINKTKGKPHFWSFLKQYYTINTIADQWKYALPQDFNRILTHPQFEVSTGYYQLKKRDAEYILERRVDSDSSGGPEYYAISPTSYEATVGTFYEMWLYPKPSQVYLLQFFYLKNPLEAENTTDVLAGGVRAAEAILESCLAVAEQQQDDTVGFHTQKADELTQALILSDTGDMAESIGKLSDPRYTEGWPPERNLYDVNILDENIYP